MTQDVRVCVSWETFYGAVVFRGGVQTSFDCNHNHHTPDAAEKCVRKMQRRADQILTNPTFEEYEVGRTAYTDERLVEWRWTETDKGVTIRRWMRVRYKEAGQGS